MSTSLVDIKDNKLVYNANVDNIIELYDRYQIPGIVQIEFPEFNDVVNIVTPYSNIGILKPKNWALFYLLINGASLSKSLKTKQKIVTIS